MPRRGGVVVLGALLVAASCSSRPPTTSDGPPRFAPFSGRLPPISAPTLTGGRVVPSEYRGRVVVLNFWNPDCPPCRDEMPVLEAAWRRLRGRGVVVMGAMFVGGFPPWPDDRAGARKQLRDFGVTYPTFVDEGSRLARRLSLPGIPATYVADRSGRIRYRLLGRIRPGEVERVVALLGA